MTSTPPCQCAIIIKVEPTSASMPTVSVAIVRASSATSSNGRLGCWHSGELIYFYGNIPADSRLFDEKDRALSETVLGYVANFAAAGDPNGPGLPPWAADDSSATILELNEDVAPVPEKYLALYAIMDRMYGWE